MFPDGECLTFRGSLHNTVCRVTALLAFTTVENLLFPYEILRQNLLFLPTSHHFIVDDREDFRPAWMLVCTSNTSVRIRLTHAGHLTSAQLPSRARRLTIPTTVEPLHVTQSPRLIRKGVLCSGFGATST